MKTHKIFLVAAIAITLSACNQPSNIKQQATASIAATPLTSLSDYQAAAQEHNVIFQLPNWEATPEQLSASADEAMRAGDLMLDEIAALSATQVTLENTLGAMDNALFHVSKTAARVDVIRETNPQENIREAARETSKKLSAWFINASFRMDVFAAIQNYAATKPTLDGEDAMLLKTTLRDYRRNGMDLPAAKRDTLQALKNRLNNLGLEFDKNISNANTMLEFTAAELDGVSDDFLNNEKLKIANGNYRINANVTWQVLELYKNAHNEATRKKISVARSSRALKPNTPIFIDLLKTRAQIAKLLGYANWADYRIETKMAKTGDNALAFEQTLNTALQEKFDQEQEVYRQLKVQETGDENAKINYWDVSYYKNQLKKNKYNVDSSKLKVFFEYNQTLNGMFGVFEEIFDLKIEQVAAPYKWVDDLTLYAISDSKTGAPLGLIYMDMFPRKGKYNHFAQFGITSGRLLEDGRQQRPVVALICNFPPAAGGKPSLLTHDNAQTLFHEFGHALHSVLSQTKYAQFSGTSVPRDFVEAPSQMLENWVWDKDVLDRFARDYRDPQKKIPADILDKMETARLAIVATNTRRQLGFGLLDLEVHMTTDEQVFDNFIEVTNRIMSETYVPVPEGTGFVTSFGHLGGGYDAGYYGYAWADSIAADMASLFKNSPGGLMDHSVGRSLRDNIYATGGAREIETSIQAFLGRKRSMDAFYEQLGLTK